MSHRRRAVAFVLVLIAGSGACAVSHSVPQDRTSLVGTWLGVSANAKGTSFVFRDDGTATWDLGQPFEIRFRTDAVDAPAELDLFGFESGPLKGRTLYCLVDVTSGRLRMDCEPTKRPAAFDDAQTQVFERGGVRASRQDPS